MKIHKNDLVKLVLNLTPRERQEFKELHSGNFDYIELFNHITKNKGLDEKVFAEQLNKQKGSDKGKTINISVIKSYLLEKILNSLRSSYKSPVALAYQNLTYSDILISKGLYVVAEDYLEETKDICKDNHLFQEELIYFRQVEQILMLNNSISTNEAIDARFSRHNKVLDLLMVECNILNFTAFVKSLAFYNISPPPDIFFGLLMKANSIDLTKNYPFLIEQQILLTKGAFEVFQMEGIEKIEEVKKLYAEGVEQWKNEQNLMDYNGYWLLNMSTGYFLLNATTGYNKEQIDSFLELLDLFEQRTKSSTEKSRIIELRYVCLMIHLQNSSEKNRYEEIIGYKEKFATLTANGFARTVQLRIWEEYTYIKAHLRLKQYNEVIDGCNYLLYDKDFNVKNFMIYYSAVHFANLQAHYELGNLKFLTYEIAKSRAILEKTIAFGEFEDEFFKLMKLLMGSTTTDKEKMVSALTVHKVAFEAIHQEGFLKANFGLYDVLGWIERMMNDELGNDE